MPRNPWHFSENIELRGWGFEPESDLSIVLYNSTFTYNIDNFISSEPKTDLSGSFNSLFTLPILKYGSYTLNITDYKENYDTFNLDIGPVISFSPTQVPSGRIISIYGKGFTPNANIDKTKILLSSSNCIIHNKDEVTVNEKGTFKIDVIVPTLEKKDHQLSVTDGILTASTILWITEPSTIYLSKKIVSPGEIVSVFGDHFTEKRGTKVILSIGGIIIKENIRTENDGKFSVNITTPALEQGFDYVIRAVDENGLKAEVKIIVDKIFFYLSKNSGKVGDPVNITVFGKSINADSMFEIFIDEDLIISATNTNVPNIFHKIFYVPQKPLGIHLIKIHDINNGRDYNLHLNITETSTLIFDSFYCPNYNLTITGKNFAPFHSTNWIISNETWKQNISSLVIQNGSPIITNSSGEFTGKLLVPSFLRPGRYTIRCTTYSENLPNIKQYAEKQINIVKDDVNVSISQVADFSGIWLKFSIQSHVQKDGMFLDVIDHQDQLFSRLMIDDYIWNKIGNKYILKMSLKTYSTEDYNLMPWNWMWNLNDQEKKLKSSIFKIDIIDKNTLLLKNMSNATISFGLLQHHFTNVRTRIRSYYSSMNTSMGIIRSDFLKIMMNFKEVQMSEKIINNSVKKLKTNSANTLILMDETDKSFESIRTLLRAFTIIMVFTSITAIVTLLRVCDILIIIFQ